MKKIKLIRHSQDINVNTLCATMVVIVENIMY